MASKKKAKPSAFLKVYLKRRMRVLRCTLASNMTPYPGQLIKVRWLTFEVVTCEYVTYLSMDERNPQTLWNVNIQNVKTIEDFKQGKRGTVKASIV